jgi:hypothetical protein
VVVVVRMKLWRWEVRKLTGLHLALNPHLTEGPKGEGRGEKLGRSLASPKTMQQNAARPDFDPAGSDVPVPGV